MQEKMVKGMTKKDYNKKWSKQNYEKNKDREIARTKKWHEENKEHMEKWHKQYRKEQKPIISKILNNLKFNGCAICGYNKCCQSLEFHHVNPKNKKFEINFCGISGRKNEYIADELNKCILLCSNCHQEIEWVK